MSNYDKCPSRKRCRARYNKKYYDRTKSDTGKKRSWTVDEINLVCEHSVTDTELATKINRSVRAIQIMRCRANKKVS